MSLLKEANRYFKNGNYVEAYKIYNEVKRKYGFNFLDINIKLCMKNMENNPVLLKDIKKINSEQNIATVDIIIPIYNALEDVKNCINSLYKHKTHDFNVIAIDDCSDDETRIYLEEESRKKGFKLLRNKENLRFTKTVNRGFKECKGDYVVLLNSDTIVTPRWIEKILACFRSDEKIGIVGPLSNAASWQSVPKLFNSRNEWNINKLYNITQINKMARIVEKLSNQVYPRVPIINGFCFAIKKEVIENVGILDEVSFPNGYGEENDFCLRSQNKGYTLAVADDTFIFHAKSKSYSHEKRKLFSTKSDGILKAKHGTKRMQDIVKELRHNEELKNIRTKIDAYLNKNEFAWKNFNIRFFLPVSGTGGGIHSIVQECDGMKKLGIDAKVITHVSNIIDYHNNYPDLDKSLFVPYTNIGDLREYINKSTVLIATINYSVKQLKHLIEKDEIASAYYIQDYEPYFYDKKTEKYQIAYESYTLVESIIPFAKTDWIRREVNTKHNIYVNKVTPSIDKNIFNTSNLNKDKKKVVVSAMIRPYSDRRSPKKTMRILQLLSDKFNKEISIRIFGCTDKELQSSGIDYKFKYKNFGILKRHEVASFFKGSDIFLDLSTFQAFGRTGLEAMSCSCLPILTKEGGVSEYANNTNSILVDVTDEDNNIINSISKLIMNKTLRKELIQKGIETSNRYSIENSVKSELSLLFKTYLEHHIQSSKIKISIIPQRMNANEFAGSGYIRLVLPYIQYDHLFDLSFDKSLKDSLSQKPEIIVLQRTAISYNDALQLIDYVRKNNIKIIYDLDDDLLLHYINDPDNYKTIEYLSKNADLLTVSTNNLMYKMLDFNRNVMLIENYLDNNVWTIPDHKNRDGNKSINILYSGTKTHEKDFSIIKNSLIKLKQKYGSKINIDIIGVVDTINSGEKEYFNYINIPKFASENYINFVNWIKSINQWDIGIAPLVENEFNRRKSYLKYLDYSALNLFTVASNVEPYVDVINSNTNGILVDNNEIDWFNTIENMINDMDTFNRIAKCAIEEVKEKHILGYNRKCLEAIMEVKFYNNMG